MKRPLLILCLLLAFGHAVAGRFVKGTRGGNSSQAMTWVAPAFDAGVGAGAVSCSYFTLKGYRASGGTIAYSGNTAYCATVTKTATGIAAGVWYWTVTATDSAGNESDPTPEETNTVP